MRLSDELRARLRDLRLVARSTAGGDGLGTHASRSRGAGLEFAQYRGYEPGDEPRRIDWKLYARSDRYFVREAERDSPLTVWVVIDASASMAQADRNRAGFSKLDAAGPRQRDRCMLELDRIACAGMLPDESQMRPLWERIRPGALVLLLSDGFDDRLVELATRLAVAHREVISVGLLSAEERDFPFHGGHRFRDPETGTELLADGDRARRDYLKRFAAAREALAKRLAAVGIVHVEHYLDRPLDEPLRRLFGAPQRAAERR